MVGFLMQNFEHFANYFSYVVLFNGCMLGLKTLNWPQINWNVSINLIEIGLSDNQSVVIIVKIGIVTMQFAIYFYLFCWLVTINGNDWWFQSINSNIFYPWLYVCLFIIIYSSFSELLFLFVYDNRKSETGISGKWFQWLEDALTWKITGIVILTEERKKNRTMFWLFKKKRSFTH